MGLGKRKEQEGRIAASSSCDPVLGKWTCLLYGLEHRGLWRWFEQRCELNAWKTELDFFPISSLFRHHLRLLLEQTSVLSFLRLSQL